MTRDITTYSEPVEGEEANYRRAVRFDRTGGFIGITQYDSVNVMADRVLLSPAQVRALLAFVRNRR